MRTATCVLALVTYAWAIPTHHLEIDWSKVRPLDVFMDPLPDAKPEIGGLVVGGNEAARNSVPYQAAVLVDGSGFCGGSLISRDWVLSAAHCTRGASYVQVILGAHNVQGGEASQIISISRDITNHPRFNPTTLANDISLVRLPSTSLLTPAIQVISLPAASSGTFAGSIALLSGWGKTSDTSEAIAATLQAINVTVITNVVCTSTYGSNIVSSTICTSGNGRVGACGGDTGGPLVVAEMQIGVVSYGSSRGCQSNLPTVYTRVSSFRSWINSVAGV